MRIPMLVTAAALSSWAAAPAFADCTLDPAAEPGKTISGVCRACHEFDPAKPSRATGPNLHDVYGRIAGTGSDYKNYSAGMRAAKDKGIAWNDENLQAYIGDTKGFLSKVSGHDELAPMPTMIRDQNKIKDLIAYLKAIKGNPECK